MKWRLICCSAATLAAFSVTAFAADEGTSLYRQKCGACHIKGGQAAPVNPADKAAIVWKKYFQRGRHKVDFSSEISDADLKHVLAYLQDHAADSDKPETAAIPK